MVFVFVQVCFGSSTCHHSKEQRTSRVFACVCLQAGEQMGIPLTQQASNESRLSMSESVSEFFDAQEVLLSASSSENEVQQRTGRETALRKDGSLDHEERVVEEVDWGGG